MAEMGIYAITHISTGRQYIGSAVDIKSRWRLHRCELAKGRHHNPKLQSGWTHYGSDAYTFSVLEYVDDAHQLVPREQHWLDTAQPHYNVLPRAGSILGSKRAPATIEKMRVAGLSQVHRSGYKLSAETRAKLSVAHRNQRPSVDARRKLSARHLELLDVARLAEQAGIEGAVLGIKEAASLAGFTRSGLTKLIHEGVIPAVKVGRVWVMRRAAFDVLLPALIERRQHRQCRAFQGERHYAARLRADDVLRIRQAYEARSASVKELAQRYGIHSGTVWAIVHRRTWKHL